MDLSECDAPHLAYVLTGFVLTTPANSSPITALVWLTSALTASGRYQAPESLGHPADLRDGGPPVDSVVLMAVVQRHILTAPASFWTNDRLAQDLGLPAQDIERAQHALDAVAQITGRPAVLGARWWER